MMDQATPTTSCKNKLLKQPKSLVRKLIMLKKIKMLKIRLMHQSMEMKIMRRCILTTLNSVMIFKKLLQTKCLRNLEKLQV
jgi:hypothetical protein